VEVPFHCSQTSNQQGNGVIIVDAGGGTLDISAYSQKEGSSTEFAEIAPAQCQCTGKHASDHL
jgi:cell division ATPase FtsA